MTVRELIEALVPFKDDDELGVAIVGWSGTHTVEAVEPDRVDGQIVEPAKPIIFVKFQEEV
jgi:hypothetical protein